MTQPTCKRRSWLGRHRLGVAAIVATTTLFAAVTARAQDDYEDSPAGRTTITPTAGWQWGGTLDYYDPSTGSRGDVHVNSAESFGVGLAKALRPGYMAELSYSYQSSELVVRPSGEADYKLFDLATHYIQISGMRDLTRSSGKVVPYGMGGLGVAVFDPGSSTAGDFSTSWRFAINVGLGVRSQLSRRLDWRLQGRLLLPTIWTQGGAWFGTGGAGIGAGGDVMPQGDALFGLSYKLGS